MRGKFSNLQNTSVDGCSGKPPNVSSVESPIIIQTHYYLTTTSPQLHIWYILLKTNWFCADGQMRNIETGEPFKFEVKEGDRAYNQKHYEALGEVRSYLHVYYVLFTCVLFTLMKTVNIHSSGHQTRFWCLSGSP